MGTGGSKDHESDATPVSLNSIVGDRNHKSQFSKLKQLRQRLTENGEQPINGAVVRDLLFDLKVSTVTQVDATAFFQSLLQLETQLTDVADKLFVMELVTDLCEFAPDHCKQLQHHVLSKLAHLSASLLHTLLPGEEDATNTDNIKHLNTLLSLIQHLSAHSRFCLAFMDNNGHYGLNSLLARQTDKASLFIAGTCIDQLTAAKPNFPLPFTSRHNTALSYLLNNPYLKAPNRQPEALRVLGSAFAMIAQYTYALSCDKVLDYTKENARALLGAGMLPRLLQGYRRLITLQKTVNETDNTVSFKTHSLRAEYHLAMALYRLLHIPDNNFPLSHAEIILAAVDHATRRRSKLKTKDIHSTTLQQVDATESCFVFALHKIVILNPQQLINKGIFRILLNVLVSIAEPPRTNALVRTRLAAAHCLRLSANSKETQNSVHLLQHTKFPLLLLHLKLRQDPAYLLQLLQLLYGLVNVKVDIMQNPTHLMVLCTVVGAPCGLLADILQQYTKKQNDQVNNTTITNNNNCDGSGDVGGGSSDGVGSVEPCMSPKRNPSPLVIMSPSTSPISPPSVTNGSPTPLEEGDNNNAESPNQVELLIFKFCVAIISCVLQYEEGAVTVQIQGVLCLDTLERYMNDFVPNSSGTYQLGRQVISRLASLGVPHTPSPPSSASPRRAATMRRSPNQSPPPFRLAHSESAPTLLVEHRRDGPYPTLESSPEPPSPSCGSTLSQPSSENSVMRSPILLDGEELLAGTHTLIGAYSPSCSRSPSTASGCSYSTTPGFPYSTADTCSVVSTSELSLQQQLEMGDMYGEITQEDTTNTTVTSGSDGTE